MNKDLAPGALAKPKPVNLKRRALRAEAVIKEKVRAACVERDGYCRVSHLLWSAPVCGPSEWAHMHSHRRSKTRGLPPEERHTTAGSLMLCQYHHDHYDGRGLPRLVIEALTDRGADGPMHFSYNGRSYTEIGLGERVDR